MKTILKRVEKKGDIWSGVLSEGVDMEKALSKIKGFLTF
jgi:hypothetical protein